MKLCCMSRHRSLIMHACILTYSCSYCNIVIYILHAVSTLQAIGDGGQGWGNCILYTFLSSEIRKKLLPKMRQLFGSPDWCRDADHQHDIQSECSALLSDGGKGSTRISYPSETHYSVQTVCDSSALHMH